MPGIGVDLLISDGLFLVQLRYRIQKYRLRKINFFQVSNVQKHSQNSINLM